MIGIKYDDTHYLYRKNFFGDVTEIYNSSGTCVTKYVYDAHGACKVLNANGTENTNADFIGNINPIRYRGYYYDVETGFYYLQTRYYNPLWARFLNADELEYLDSKTIGGLNLYAYCNCNPIKQTVKTVTSLFGGCAEVIEANQSPYKSAQSQVIDSPFNIEINGGNHFTSVYYTATLFDQSSFGAKLFNLSATVTQQLNSCEGFGFTYNSTGYVNGEVGSVIHGAGININNWYKLSGYYSVDIDSFGVGLSTQITPWLTIGFGIDTKNGITKSIGIINGDTTTEITYSIGTGTIALAALAVGITEVKAIASSFASAMSKIGAFIKALMRIFAH